MEPFLAEIRIFASLFEPLFELIAQVRDAIVALFVIVI